MKILLTISFLAAFGAFAQHEPTSDMYWNNYSYFNPAMSGVKYKHEANVSYRSQFNNEFSNYSAWFANYGTNIKEKHGFGLNYVNETIWISRVDRVKLNYNYQFELKEGRKLAVGTAVSFRSMSLSPNWFEECPMCDPHYSFPKKVFQLDLGAAYYGKNITAGLGLTQIQIYKNSEYDDHIPHLTGNFRYEELLSFPRGSLFLETKIQTDFVRYRQDFNIGYTIKEFLEVGLGYRTSDAVSINVTGVVKKRYRIGYSYAMTINALSSYSTGTHEFTLGLRLPNN